MSILRREGALRVSRYTLKNVPLAIVTPINQQLMVMVMRRDLDATHQSSLIINPQIPRLLSNPQYINFSQYRILKNENKEIDKKELERKINVNKVVDQLREYVPDILETSLPKSIISKDIYLRICPSQFDENYLPKLNGLVTYYTTCKAIQLFLTSVMLSPKVKLHIQSIRVSHGPDPQCMFNDTTKIFLRWSTCPDGCSHLDAQGTSQAHLGTHKWSEEDTKKIFDNHKSLSTLVSKLPGTIMGLTKEPKKLERVISGLFIFELNEDNSKILVHTIENMEIIERFEPETQPNVNALRVC